MTLNELFNHPSVRGVTIGCCASGDPIPEGEFGHAHLDGDKRYAGLICVRSLANLVRGISDLPAASTSIHELAHLISQSEGEPWRQAMKDLGRAREAAIYHKRRKT